MFRLFFEKHEADAVERTGSARLHESGTHDSRYPDALDLARELESRLKYSDFYYYYWGRGLSTTEHCEKLFLERPDRKRTAPFALGMIRKSLAAGAITATHLEKITEALRKRRRPIRPRCPFVSTGKPSRFVWSPSKDRFVRHEKGGESDLVLTLLGPADELVEKHRHRLPVGSYFFSLMYRYEAIHLESITPSNQLSYIFTLEMRSQRILISGDAGCYGFRKKRKNYYPALLQPLSPLQIIQVAHHAGHNYDFYNALLAAGFASQNEHAFLLLSHRKHDPHRPSKTFQDFVAQVRREPDNISLLFTCVPDNSRVQDYCELIHPPVPAGTRSDEGSVRLSYPAGKDARWTVERHSVVV